MTVKPQKTLLFLLTLLHALTGEIGYTRPELESPAFPCSQRIRGCSARIGLLVNRKMKAFVKLHNTLSSFLLIFS